MLAKQTNTVIVAKIAPMESICSIKPLDTYKMYRNCEEIKLPIENKPKSTFLLNGYFWFGWCDGLIPKIAKFFWTFLRNFIFNNFNEYILSKFDDNNSLYWRQSWNYIFKFILIFVWINSYNLFAYPVKWKLILRSSNIAVEGKFWFINKKRVSWLVTKSNNKQFSFET